VPKPPKIQPTDPEAKQPDPAIIRNPYLDGASDFAIARMGRSQLRINPGAARVALPPSAPRAPAALRIG
jgi:hypothetical protein